jgi:hypothetical protein
MALHILLKSRPENDTTSPIPHGNKSPPRISSGILAVLSIFGQSFLARVSNASSAGGVCEVASLFAEHVIRPHVTDMPMHGPLGA